EHPLGVDEPPALARRLAADAQGLGRLDWVVGVEGEADVAGVRLVVGDAAAVLVDAIVREIVGTGVAIRIAVVAVALRGRESIPVEVVVGPPGAVARATAPTGATR